MHARLSIIILLAAVAACSDSPADQALSQVDATPTLPGLCSADAEPCSDEGARTCSDHGIRTCIDVAGCLQWGVEVACTPGTTCVPDGAGASCAASCDESECTVPEARRCAPGAAASFQRCAEDPDSGCLAWSAAVACPDGQTCGQGGACSTSCADECGDGTKRCEGNTVVTCGQYDGDTCLEWGGATACPVACALGACVDSCQDECASDGLKRCDGATVQRCSSGSDGCHHWVPAESCGAGTTCSVGACAVDCVDECQEGATSCEGGGVVSCVQRDSDSCRDRSLPVACQAGTTCTNGVCTPNAQCSDECTGLDERRCDATGLAIEGCGQHDTDPCLEWAVIAQCGATQTCSLGLCVDGCQDECHVGERRCRPGSVSAVEVCRADGDADACSEWTADVDCAASNQICTSGACASTCTDECSAGSTCDGNAVVPCGDFDTDSCRDRGPPAACGPTEQCTIDGTQAHCVARPPPGNLKISEVLYNSEGVDDDTFIELAGEPGTPLAGFVLQALDGFDGQVYATLPLSGAIPADGFFVIAHPQAEAAIGDEADMKDAFVDLQNSPDSLALVFGATTVDALGYGLFTSQNVFRGEGQSAPNVAQGHSLARKGALQDTNDNRADFEDVANPTPGKGFLAAKTPTHEGDLVITELMIDPKVLADTQGEWFELYNPSAIDTWDLSGCELASDSFESHTIAAHLLVAPGARVVLARSANPGFTPDYVYQGITLANAQDYVELDCGAVTVDIVAWFTTAPNGKSLSLDPAYETAEGNDDDEHAFCPAPVDAANGADAGTPKLPNPPCGSSSGTYTRATLDSTWGSCDTQPNWLSFSFVAAPEATGNATLTFEWESVFCPVYAENSRITIQLKNGDEWAQVAQSSFSSVADACAWLSGSTAVAKTIVNKARATSGVIEGRVRIEGGCPQGVGCGLLGTNTPYNCTRDITVSYPY